MQYRLRISSLIYMCAGSALFLFFLFINSVAILFLVSNRKAKYSPICIFLLFLAVFNLFKLTEFMLSFIIKLRLLAPSSDNSLCQWLNFLPFYSGHVSVYIVLLLQLQFYAARLLRGRVHSKSKILFYMALIVNNYALSYIVCFGLIVVFFLVDEFYLYDNYFCQIIYCPLTMIYTCVLDDNFKLLNTYKFDTLVYHHFHTVLFNLIPFVAICVINGLLAWSVLRERRDLDDEPNMSEATPSIQTKSNKFSDDGACCEDSGTSYFNWPPPITKFRVEMRSECEIYLSSSVVTNSRLIWSSILVSFLQIANTFPGNLLSYLAEWNAETMANMINKKSNETTTDYRNMPIRVLGDKNNLSHTEIFFVYILNGLGDQLNFNLYLIYQLCCHKQLFDELRLFVKKRLLRIKST